MNPLVEIIISHNDDDATMAAIMTAAILSLFLVFLVVTLLHCYARWFLSRGGEGRPPPVLVVPPRLLILRHLLNMDSTVYEMSDQPAPVKGLDSRVISSIPLFVFDEERGEKGLECVVCLSLFGDGEMGRRLPICGHAFHVACIDMWLGSHSTCPVCRAPAVCSNDVVVLDSISGGREIDVDERSVGVTSPDDTRISVEFSSRLEIVVEVTSSENGCDGRRKVHSSV